MSAPFLLDANVLIAVSSLDHTHHERARRWLSEVSGIAVCPITQGALVRYLIRTGESPSVVHEALDLMTRRPGYEFWPDDIDYREVDMRRIQGHRQVTDTYLIALAEKHESSLATLDEGLAHTYPHASFLIP
ncbi:MAG: PIN domain-containing protein [Propionibacteriaceae bacterium]|jgi:toxin-antitoxin system PIN domain toxin|nr:PIN domain-containing protein [Propionibacteriaceae bacterium]